MEEARVCAKLEHPGIVRIYDVGWLATDVCFIAMELCSGGSMDLIAKGLCIYYFREFMGVME